LKPLLNSTTLKLHLESACRQVLMKFVGNWFWSLKLKPFLGVNFNDHGVVHG
jgi:hypothetical protein